MAKLGRIYAFAKFEFLRVFSSKRGWFALGAFAIVWYFILRYLVGSATDFLTSDMFRDMARQAFGMFGLSELLRWPVPELAIYWLVTVFWFPLFTLYIASDQLCSDRQRGTLRFITLRATRAEVIAGRFLGQLTNIALLILLTLIAVLIMASFSENFDIIFSVKTAMSILMSLVVIVAPFVAVMSFINSFVRSARLSIVFLVLMVGIGNILIAYLEYQWGFGGQLSYLFPGTQITTMVNPSSSELSNYLIALLQTAGYLTFAKLILDRSAL